MPVGILALLLLGSFCTRAQQSSIHVKTLTVEDGLSSRNITRFFKDQKGFVWFGSDDGINCYDAFEVRSYKPKDGAEFYVRYVDNMAQDSAGRIWIRHAKHGATSVGLSVFNPANGEFVPFRSYFKNPVGFQSEELSSVKNASDFSGIWLSTTTGKVFFHSNRNRGNGLSKPVFATPRGESILDIFPSRNTAWVQLERQLLQIDKAGNILKDISLQAYKIVNVLAADADENIFYIVDDLHPYRKNLVFKNRDLLDFIPEHYRSTHSFLGLDPFSQLLWYTDEKGFTEVYDFTWKLVNRHKSERSYSSYPRYIYFDRSGVGWNNQNGEVFHISLVKSHFKNALQDIYAFNLPFGARGMMREGNTLFVNGLGGTFSVNLSTGTHQRFDIRESIPVNPNFNLGNNLKKLAIAPTADPGALWLTDEFSGLIRYTMATKKAEVFYYDPRLSPDKLPQMHWTMFYDQQGTLWLGHNTGISFFDPKKKMLKRYDRLNGYDALAKGSVFFFHENKNGIWIAGENGLFLLHPQQGIIDHYHTNGAPGKIIPHNIIDHIYEDPDGTFWLASKGGGIIHLNTVTGEFKQYTISEGLSDNTVYAIYEDSFGKLWLSSNHGIMQIHKETMEVKTFLPPDGIGHAEFNTTSHLKDEQGVIYFGNLNGITYFDPKDFNAADVNELVPQVTKVQSQSRKSGDVTERSPGKNDQDLIRIYPEDLAITIQFAVLDYINPDKKRYAYKIEGIDKHWNYISEPVIRLNALPYGKHLLLLKGQNSRGVWTHERKITIEAVKPFYFQWWFVIVTVTGLVIMVILIIELRIRQLKQSKLALEKEVQQRTLKIREQTEELKSLDQLKSRFFSNISHELRTPLSLILGPVTRLLTKSDINQEVKKDLAIVTRSAKNMSDLIDEILELSRLQDKKMNIYTTETVVYSFFRNIYNDYKAEADSQRIQFHLELPPERFSLHFAPSIVSKIVNNLLSNAFKFTPTGGTIALEVSLVDRHLRICVSDTGSGISPQDIPHIFERYFQTKDVHATYRGGFGIGLAMCRELCDMINATIQVESTLGKGSRFTVSMPADQIRYFQDTDEIQPEEAVEEGATSLKQKIDLLARKAGEKTPLLLVEDNPDLQRFLSEALQFYFHVHIAGNGQEALDYLSKNQPPVVIVSDIMMPVMDGITFLKQLKSESRYARIPVLMLTARSGDEEKVTAFHHGASDYLLKPFSLLELEARIYNLIKVAESIRVTSLTTDINYSKELLDDKMESWLLRVKEITQEKVSNVDFNIATVAEIMGLSERQFQRKLKEATGYSPVLYLREIRLQMARTYLERKTYTKIAELSRAVGFTSTPYFSRLFFDRFGKYPKDYLDSPLTHSVKDEAATGVNDTDRL